MTHHAAALTYYALISLFPAVLLALSLLGLLGQYPETYNAIMGYLREVAPASVVDPLDRSLRGALQSKGTAATALVISGASSASVRPLPGPGTSPAGPAPWRRRCWCSPSSTTSRRTCSNARFAGHAG